MVQSVCSSHCNDYVTRPPSGFPASEGSSESTVKDTLAGGHTTRSLAVHFKPQEHTHNSAGSDKLAGRVPTACPVPPAWSDLTIGTQLYEDATATPSPPDEQSAIWAQVMAADPNVSSDSLGAVVVSTWDIGQ